MDFLKKLDYLMEQHKLNKHTLSLSCGVPYTTIDSFYKKGYANAKLSTVEKIANYFNTSIDYLMREEITDPNYGTTKKQLQISVDEKDIIDKYRKTDEYGRETVRFTVDREYKRTKEQHQKEQSTNSNIVEMQKPMTPEETKEAWGFEESARDTYGTKDKYNTNFTPENVEKMKKTLERAKKGEYKNDRHR